MKPLRTLAAGKLKGKLAIAVMSSKGGVGKSVVSALLANVMSARVKTLLLDLDVHTMASAKLFGLEGRVHQVSKRGLEPFPFGDKLGVITLSGVVKDRWVLLPGANQALTMESLLAYSDMEGWDAVIFDLPPGLGDEVLVLGRVSDYLPLVVTSPSKVSVKVVEYLLKFLSETGKRPALTVNMAYYQCQGQVVRPFGDGRALKELTERYGVPMVELPIDPELEEFVGRIQEYDGPVLEGVREITRILER